MNIKRAILLGVLVVLLMSISFTAQAEDCGSAMMKYCKSTEESSKREVIRCAKKNLSKLTPVCQKEIQGEVKEIEVMLNTCRKQYLKTCRWDIDKAPREAGKKTQKIFQCLLAHWDEYSEECKDYVRGSVPFFGILEQDLDVELWKHQTRKRKKVKVAGVRKKVPAEAIDGNIIWYRANFNSKKVMDQYEFCPELPEELGLEKGINRNQGTCSYQVKASWGGGVINELKSNKLLDKITHYGLYWFEDFFELNPGIEKIIKRYSKYCPKKFEIEIYNSEFSNEQYVYCKMNRHKKGNYTCPNGYVRFHISDGYLGCRKLASCEESGEGYVEFGDKKQCAVCYAGGWVDQEKKNDVLCKVNAKNPEDESVCVEEVKRTYYENGVGYVDCQYEQCQCVASKMYDKKGNLFGETEGSHRGNSLMYGTTKSYYPDGSLKGESEFGGIATIIWSKDYDRQGNLTREY